MFSLLCGLVAWVEPMLNSLGPSGSTLIPMIFFGIPMVALVGTIIVSELRIADISGGEAVKRGLGFVLLVVMSLVIGYFFFCGLVCGNRDLRDGVSSW